MLHGFAEVNFFFSFFFTSSCIDYTKAVKEQVRYAPEVMCIDLTQLDTNTDTNASATLLFFDTYRVFFFFQSYLLGSLLAFRRRETGNAKY